MRAIGVVIGLLIMVSSPAFGDEADVNPETDFELFYTDMAFLGPHWDLVERHWIDGCQVTIELSDTFVPTDAGCQEFGELVRWILKENPEICLVYVLPDSSGWVPSLYNPIDYDWALCLSDEFYCPDSTQASEYQVIPPRPIPVTVENTEEYSDSGSGGCFIQTLK